MNDKDCAKCGAELVWIGSVMGGKMCCPQCTVPTPEAQALANTAVTMPGSAKLAEVDIEDLLAMKPGMVRAVDASLRDAVVHGKEFTSLTFDELVGTARPNPTRIYKQHWEAVAQREYAEKVKTRCQGQTAAQAMEEMRGRDPRRLIAEAQMLLRDLRSMTTPHGASALRCADRLRDALDYLARELHRS